MKTLGIGASNDQPTRRASPESSATDGAQGIGLGELDHAIVMASSLLDELPCLLEEGDELMARWHAWMPFVLSEASPSASATSKDEGEREITPLRPDAPAPIHPFTLPANLDVAAILSGFAKGFFSPTTTDKSATAPPLLVALSSDARFALLSRITEGVHLLKRVHQWQQTTWETLTQWLSEPLHLTLDKHRQLTSLLLAVVAQYVKVHLLWTACPHIAGLIGLHAWLTKDATPTVAVSEQDQAQEQDRVDRDPLREYVLCFAPSPLVRILQDLQVHARGVRVAHNLATIVLSACCADGFLACRDLAKLKTQGIWDAEALVDGKYASASLHLELQRRPILDDWLLCVALLVPQQWLTPVEIADTTWRLWDLLEQVLRDRLLITIHRDLAVNVHDLLYQQLSAALAFPPASASLALMKKPLRQLSKQAIHQAAIQRHARRQTLRWILRTCCHAIQQSAARIAPLLPMLLGVCAVAQEDIAWMLLHASTPRARICPRHTKTKHFQRAQHTYDVDVSEIAEVVRGARHIRVAIARRAEDVRRYYRLFLAQGDADAILHAILAFLSQAAAATPLSTGSGSASNDENAMQLVPHVRDVLQGLADPSRFQPQGATPDHSEEARAWSAWRREWQQLSVALVLQHVAMPLALTQSCELALRHVDYVISLDRVLDRSAAFASCWWHIDQFEQWFDQLLTSADAAGTVLVWIELLQAIADGEVALEQVVDAQDAASQATRLQICIQRLHCKTGRAMEDAIQQVVEVQAKLHGELSPARYIEAMDPSRRAARSTMHMPGSESRLCHNLAHVAAEGDAESVRCVKAVHAAQSLLNSLVVAIHQSSQNPARWLVLLLEQCVRRCIRRFLEQFLPVDARMPCLPWHIAVSQWRGLQRCLLHLAGERHPLVDIAAITSDVLRIECHVHPPLEQTQSVAAPSPELLPSTGLLDRLALFYLRLIDQQCVPRLSSHSASQWIIVPSQLVLVRRPGIAMHLHRDHHKDNDLTMADPMALVSPAAFEHLRAIIGVDGLQWMHAQWISELRRCIATLWTSVEQDQIALIRLRMAFPDDVMEITQAIRLMTNIDLLMDTAIRICCLLVLLQLVDQQHGISDPLQQVLQAADNETKTKSPKTTPSPLHAHMQARADLLPWVVVALLHASIWPATEPLPEIDATSTNVHLAGQTMGLLVTMVGSSLPTPAATTDKLSSKIHLDPSDDHARRDRLAQLASQAVLALHRIDRALPSSSQLTLVRHYARSLAWRSSRSLPAMA